MSDAREAELLAIIDSQGEQLAAAKALIEQQKIENKLLRQKIDALVRRIFGSQSEPNGVR